MTITFIYGLKDPETNEIRYVGQSRRPKNRYHRHISEARNNKGANPHKRNWLNLILNKGLKPELVILMECPSEVAHQFEDSYIALYNSTNNKPVTNSPGIAIAPNLGVKQQEVDKYNRRLEGLNRSNNRTNKLYLGVSPNGANNFRARYRKDKKRYELGSYPTAELAAKAWDSAMAYLFPYHTLFNFPDSVIPLSPETLRQNSSHYLNKTTPYYGVHKETKSKFYIAIFNEKKYSFPTAQEAAYYRDCLERYYNPITPRINFPEGFNNRMEALSEENVRKISRTAIGKPETKTAKYKYVLYVKQNKSYGFEFKHEGTRHRKSGFATETEAAIALNTYISDNNIDKPLLIIE